MPRRRISRGAERRRRLCGEAGDGGIDGLAGRRRSRSARTRRGGGRGAGMRRGAGRARETGAADERGTGDGSARRCPCRRGVPRRSEAVCVRAQERLCEWRDARPIRCCRVPASMLIIVYLHIASILSPLRTGMCTLSRGDGSRISQEKKTEQHRLSLSTRATLDNRAVANTHRPTWPIDTAPELCC